MGRALSRALRQSETTGLTSTTFRVLINLGNNGQEGRPLSRRQYVELFLNYSKRFGWLNRVGAVATLWIQRDVFQERSIYQEDVLHIGICSL